MTLAVLVSGWAHVLHAVYKPWGQGTVLYMLQHGSLFVTSFVFLMGLLFKVDGVDSASPAYSSLSQLMLAMCTIFLIVWLAVVCRCVLNNLRRASRGQSSASSEGSSALPGASSALEVPHRNREAFSEERLGAVVERPASTNTGSSRVSSDAKGEGADRTVCSGTEDSVVREGVTAAPPAGASIAAVSRQALSVGRRSQSFLVAGRARDQESSATGRTVRLGAGPVLQRSRAGVPGTGTVVVRNGTEPLPISFGDTPVLIVANPLLLRR